MEWGEVFIHHSNIWQTITQASRRWRHHSNTKQNKVTSIGYRTKQKSSVYVTLECLHSAERRPLHVFSSLRFVWYGWYSARHFTDVSPAQLKCDVIGGAKTRRWRDVGGSRSATTGDGSTIPPTGIVQKWLPSISWNYSSSEKEQNIYLFII